MMLYIHASEILVGSVPDHRNEARITIESHRKSSDFPVHIKLMFALFCSLLSLHAQLCPTLFELMDCSLPGSSVHGILQARVLEWVAISSSKRSSHPGIELAFLVSPASVGSLSTTAPPGKPSK